MVGFMILKGVSFLNEVFNKMKSNRSVAVCDILGFSNLVKSVSLDVVVDRHLGQLRKALWHSIHKGDFPEKNPSLEEIRNEASLGLAWFSDTILIYTFNDSDEAFRELLVCLSWLIFETMLGGGTRIRCGVSYGEIYIDTENSFYIGKPIIEAYQLQQEQAWSGGALTPKAVECCPEIARSGKFVDWFLIPYDVPLKQNKALQTLAINWTIGLHPIDFNLAWSQTSLEPSAEDWQTRPDICEKWFNTRAFHKKVCRRCR